MIDTITANGLLMGTLNSGYIFKKFSGFGMPELRVDIQDNGNFLGARLGTINYGRRIIQMEGEIIGIDREDYENKRQALLEAFDISNGLTKMYVTLTDGEKFEIMVILNAPPIMDYLKGDAVVSDFRVEVVAPLPFFLKSDQTIVILSTLNGGGGEIPMAIPFSLANGTQGILSAINTGNTKAFPKVKFNGAMTNPVLTNSTSGKSLTLTKILGSSDYVEIDMAKHTALMNGSIDVFKYVSGDWWLMEKGSNTLILNATSPDSAANAVVIFNSTYLGL